MSGYNYWSFDNAAICSIHPDPDDPNANLGTVKYYCFENPWLDLTRSDLVEWRDATDRPGLTDWNVKDNTGEIVDIWEEFAAIVTGRGADHPGACFICGCERIEGCFAPGVKITMADGSLRNIEDVRAGDMVRNAKTGAPVKVAKVIEGPEALPLVRFGFDGATVTTSQAHPVLTATGLKPANQLKQGDSVFDAQGNPHPVTILETLPIEEGQRVINVDLEAASSDDDARLIVSDGIITGDIVLQGLLKERK